MSHQQSVTQSPAAAVVLAYNAFEPYHGFRLGENALGLQFHPEFSGKIITAYIHERSLAINAEGMDVEQLLGNTRPSPDATSLLKGFADIVKQR